MYSRQGIVDKTYGTIRRGLAYVRIRIVLYLGEIWYIRHTVGHSSALRVCGLRCVLHLGEDPVTVHSEREELCAKDGILTASPQHLRACIRSAKRER